MEQNEGIVSTTKFKPSKPSLATLQRQQQKQESVVDDWDADSSGDDASSQQDPFHQTKQEWTRANEQARSTTPVVMSNTRSLPSSAYGHGLISVRRSDHSSSSSTLPHHGLAAPAPPRILQRPKNVAPGSHSDGSRTGKTLSAQDTKTVEQRQEQYRQARARIFGQSDMDNSSSNDAVHKPKKPSIEE